MNTMNFTLTILTLCIYTKYGNKKNKTKERWGINIKIEDKRNKKASELEKRSTQSIDDTKKKIDKSIKIVKQNTTGSKS